MKWRTKKDTEYILYFWIYPRCMARHQFCQRWTCYSLIYKGISCSGKRECWHPWYQATCLSYKVSAGSREQASKEGCTRPHTWDVLPVSKMLHHGRIETAQLLKSSTVTRERACPPFIVSRKISNLLGSSAWVKWGTWSRAGTRVEKKPRARFHFTFPLTIFQSASNP